MTWQLLRQPGLAEAVEEVVPILRVAKRVGRVDESGIKIGFELQYFGKCGTGLLQPFQMSERAGKGECARECCGV